MAEIINEMPDELEMEGDELEVDLDEGKKRRLKVQSLLLM